jgi:hypothetical protein
MMGPVAVTRLVSGSVEVTVTWKPSMLLSPLESVTMTRMSYSP